MSFTHPQNSTPRESVVDAEGLWCKMYDPPRLHPPTPELLDLLNLPQGVFPNPVPSVMQAQGLANPGAPYEFHLSLMHGDTRPTWDGGANGGRLNFFLIAHNDLIGTVPDLADPAIVTGGSPRLIGASAPQFPAPTPRWVRGAINHNKVDCQGPPPHTIHWHGIEPTPMNDGVGHCSFEVEGAYIYQWQANFIGTYFYHCHRNTMQHFEFGLAGIMPVVPPDAYWASVDHFVNAQLGTVVLNDIKIGASLDGKYRTAANLDTLPAVVKARFPGYIPGHPVQGVNVPAPAGRTTAAGGVVTFKTDPLAYTVPYDVEVIWVPDDRSSQWSDGAPDPFTTFPEHGTIPGVNDRFDLRPGVNGFFAFNDFNADYWYITGVPVAAAPGGEFLMPKNLLYPGVLNSGQGADKNGVDVPDLQTRVDIRAQKGQTVFLRCLNAAYNSTRYTFPVDVVIIEWDGRALGVPEPAIRVFCDAEIRGHVVFQLSKLVSTLLRRVRGGISPAASDTKLITADFKASGFGSVGTLSTFIKAVCSESKSPIIPRPMGHHRSHLHLHLLFRPLVSALVSFHPLAFHHFLRLRHLSCLLLTDHDRS